MKKRWTSYFPTVVCLCFVLLFGYTGYDKLMHLQSFTGGIAKVPYVGHFASAIGWAVPLSELLLGLLLIIPQYARVALKLSVVLMVLFSIYLGISLLFWENRLCHCGGVISSMGWRTHLFFNAAFILAGIGALRIRPYQFNSEQNGNNKKFKENRPGIGGFRIGNGV